MSRNVTDVSCVSNAFHNNSCSLKPVNVCVKDADVDRRYFNRDITGKRDFSVSLRIVLFNARGFLSKIDELDAILTILEKPELVALTETWLDPSVTEIGLSEYVPVSRRDRDDGRIGGGVMLFAHESIAPHIVHTGSSMHFERTWHVFHSNQGAVSICWWCRHPNRGEIQSIAAFDEELGRM